MIFPLERGFQIKAFLDLAPTHNLFNGETIFHPLAMWDDIEAPVLEFLDLVLLVTDNNGHLRLPHPGDLLAADHALLIVSKIGQILFQLFEP
ncbi:hypothetical protein D3C72_1948210 [compost metagenome]